MTCNRTRGGFPKVLRNLLTTCEFVSKLFASRTNVKSVLVAAAILLTTVSIANADWINLTGAETAPNIAEIRVLDDRVNVRLEVFVGNLKTFIDVIPDELLNNAITGRPSETERLDRFSREMLSIRGADGIPLRAILRLVEPRMRVDRKSPFAGMINPQTRRRAPQAPADKRVLFVELDYPFHGKPDQLTIVPPLDENQNTIAAIGFIAYHKTVPIIDFRYLSQAARLQLNWDDPWYSQFDNRNLTRHHRNPLMSFLYVEPRRVRHEVLARVRDLEGWTDLDLGNRTEIAVDVQEQVKERALAFFKIRNPLKIDGILSHPAAWRAEFLNLSINGVQVIEDPVALDLSTAVIGISLTYPIAHLPKSVTVDWQLFEDRIDRIPTTVVDPAGPFLTYIDKDNPIIEWANYLKTYVEPTVQPVPLQGGRSITIPLISVIFGIGAFAGLTGILHPRILTRKIWTGLCVICVIGAVSFRQFGIVEVRNPLSVLPDKNESAIIINAILDNVHIAYLESMEPELDRALATIVANHGFAETKAELTRAVAIKIAGGGIANVNAVENLTVQDITPPESGSGFRSLVEWTALASGRHWGHPHRRRIRFRALMEIGEFDGAWKLTGITVVNAKQEG